MRTPPTEATRTGPVVTRSGSRAGTARDHERAGPADLVRVVVVVAGFHYGGRQYGWRDELDVDADHLQQWLASGMVRLAQEPIRDPRDVLDAFAREHPVDDHGDRAARRLERQRVTASGG